MKHEFWHDKWQRNEIGFHNSEVHPLLVKHFSGLGQNKGSRIFLPLCGKTLDIAWLLGKGYRVVGAELSELAVRQLFEQLGVEPQVEAVGSSLKRFHSEGLDIFAGDIFELTGQLLGEVDAVYDRAALVALPEEMRAQYTRHLVQMTSAVPQLLVTFEYDQDLMPGPPFCVSDDEVLQHYASHYRCTLVDAVAVPGGLKGKCPADEKVWILDSN
ncbi:thiopurine S-methyltransferase [Microbulbifer elongatus]|uniref:thiopurine S-methyltransferase n=1 Tax=Microbulbifer elongatus TaxID=86173 RepID=UPI001CFE0FD0|nr:thiopurine S-methyltransferase [Microbulbifer elongatus]